MTGQSDHEQAIAAAKKAFYREMDAGLGVENAIDAYLKARNAEPIGYVTIPVEPTESLLKSMAIRYDHGLAVPGYYDQQVFGAENVGHARRMEATMSMMRQLHEEVVGKGFYRASPSPSEGAAAPVHQVVVEYDRREAICTETAMSQWERSLKRSDMAEKDRIRGAIEAYKRQAFAFAMLPAPADHVAAAEQQTEAMKRLYQKLAEEGGGNWAIDVISDVERIVRMPHAAPADQMLPPVVTGQMEIEPDVKAADLGVNAEPADNDISPYEQALRDAVEPFLDWLEQREEGAHIAEVREGLIGVEDVIPDNHVVLGAHPRSHKDQGVITIGHFRKLLAAYEGRATATPETKP